RSAIDRAGDFPAGSHAQLAQAIAGLAAATVLRVVDRGVARIQVDLGVVHYAADEQATDHVAPCCFGPGSSLGPPACACGQRRCGFFRRASVPVDDAATAVDQEPRALAAVVEGRAPGAVVLAGAALAQHGDPALVPQDLKSGG